MSFITIGKIIYWKRKAMGISQEDLADGICSVSTLSRIENGERIPTQNHLEPLLQRLGYTNLIFDAYADEEAFLAHELKFKTRQAYFEGDYTLSKELLSKFEPLVKKASHIDRQFILLMNILLYPEQYTKEARLQELEAALRLTQPKYKSGQVPFPLSYAEIVLLNNIAISLANCGNKRTAIDILYKIVDYYDSHIDSIEESLRTQPMTLYNLSKMLGMENRYQECIDICDKGIALAQKTGCCTELTHTLYNKAWVLIKRGDCQDSPQAKELLRNALNIAGVLNQTHIAVLCRRLAEEHQLGEL